MFNREFFSVASAVGVGGLIGALLSIEIASYFDLGNLLWIFGALFGGCVAYVLADFKQFRQGVSSAWEKTISWRPNMLYWKTLIILSIGYSLAYYSTMLMVSIMILVYVSISEKYLETLFVLNYSYMIISVILGILSAMFMILDCKNPKKLSMDKNHGVWLITRWNPVSAPFSAIFYSFKGIMLVVLSVPIVPMMVSCVWKISKASKPFLLVALKNVHSQKRIVAFVDAVVCAVIGLVFDSALWGVVIGLVVILPIHWELISVRLLKVEPR